MAHITLNVGGSTTELESAIRRSLNKRYSLSGLDSRGFTQPLGKIRGELGEFQKSLEASNARVLAFGASAGAIYAIGAALQQTISQAVKVEKSLKDINVILSLSSANLAKFGDSLFKVAANTGQSFATVSDAAVELSRQGLGVEATLKRLSDAMILSRLSGLNAKSSVEALTAALNSFSRTALTSTEVLNKMAAVDAAFAVSSQDLAEGIKRVASTAATAGVSIDELMSLITAAQQITARGGNVIGNSFKTIFTRLQRPRVIEALQSLGIQVKNTQGVLLPLITILKNLSTTYDTLSQAQQAQIAELVGGVFQINILKATMSDLSKQNSIFSQSMRIAATATDEANRRNKELNQTLSAQLNRTLQNLTKTAAGVGELTFGPLIKNLTGGLNALMESEGQTDGIGQKLGKGLMAGLGSFISGPGMAILVSTLTKLFGKLASFSKDAFSGVSGITTASQQRANLEKQILEMLSKEPALVEGIKRGILTIDQLHQHILQTQKAENVQAQQAIAYAKALAAAMSTTPAAGGRRASGYVPRYQKDAEERQASALGAGNVSSFQGPGKIGGRSYMMNTGEIPLSVPWSNEPAILPTYGSAGRQTAEELARGFASMAEGWVPRFQGKGATNKATKTNVFVDEKGKEHKSQDAMKAGTIPENMWAKSNKVNGATMIIPKTPGSNKSGQLGFVQGRKSSITDHKGNPYYASFPVHTYNEDNVVGGQKGNVKDISGKAEKLMLASAESLANSIALPPGQKANKKLIKDLVKREIGGAGGAIQGFAGAAFEAAMKASLGFENNSSAAQKNAADFDLRGAGITKAARTLFGLHSKTTLADYKVSASEGNINSMADKVVKEGISMGVVKKPGGDARGRKKKVAKGYVPRYYEDAYNAEVKGLMKQYGMNRNQADSAVYPAIDKRITQNAMGLGIFNRLHEPNGPGGVSTKRIKRGGKAKGYVPRYQIEGMDTAAGGLAGLISGLSSQFMMLGAVMGNAAHKVEEARNSQAKYALELDKTKAAQAAVKTLKAPKVAGPELAAEMAKRKAGGGDMSDAEFKDARKAAAEEAAARRAARTTLRNYSDTIATAARTGGDLSAAQAELAAAERRQADQLDAANTGVEEAEASSQAQQKFQEKMMRASMLLSMFGGLLSQVGDQSSAFVRGLQSGVQGATAAASIMMAIPTPAGRAIGAFVGVSTALIGVFKAATDVSQGFAKSFDQIKDRNARLVESIDNYTQVTDKLTQVQSDLTAPTRTVLRLQKEQARALANVKDSGLRTELAMAATPADRQDAAARAKGAAQQETAQAQFALDMGKMIDDDMKSNWTFGMMSGTDAWAGDNDPLNIHMLDGLGKDMLDAFGSLKAADLTLDQAQAGGFDISQDDLTEMQAGFEMLNNKARSFNATLSQTDFDKFVQELKGIDAFGDGIDLSTAGPVEMANAMADAGAISRDVARSMAVLAKTDPEAAAQLAQAIKEHALEVDKMIQRERALSGVRQGLANAAQLAADAVAAADERLRDATDAFYQLGQAISEAAFMSDKLAQASSRASDAQSMAFAKERIKTASPTMGRGSKEAADFAVKRAEFQAKAIAGAQDVESKMKTEMTKGSAKALANELKKAQQKPGEPMDPAKEEKRKKIMAAQLKLQQLEATRETMTPAAYQTALEGLLTGADFKEILPHIQGLKSGIVTAVNKGNNELALHSIEMRKQQAIMEQARREQLKRLQADEDATKMGGIKAFTDPKSMASTFADVQKQSARLAAGGGPVAQGQAAMAMAMHMKNLTGAKTVDQLGGLGDLAIEGRAEQIRSQSADFAQLMRQRAAQTADPKARDAMLKAAQQADANANRAHAIAKEQVDRELKLENAALEQVNLLGQVVGLLGGQAGQMTAMVAAGNAAAAGINAQAAGAAVMGTGALGDPMAGAQAVVDTAAAEVGAAQETQSGIANAKDLAQQIQAAAQKEEDTKGTGQTLSSDWMKDWATAGPRITDEALKQLRASQAKDRQAGLAAGVDSEETKKLKKQYDDLVNNSARIEKIWKDAFKNIPNQNQAFGAPVAMGGAGGAAGGAGGPMPVAPAGIADGMGIAIAGAGPAAFSLPHPGVFGSPQHVRVVNGHEISSPVSKSIKDAARRQKVQGGLMTAGAVGASAAAAYGMHKTGTKVGGMMDMGKIAEKFPKLAQAIQKHPKAMSAIKWATGLDFAPQAADDVAKAVASRPTPIKLPSGGPAPGGAPQPKIWRYGGGGSGANAAAPAAKPPTPIKLPSANAAAKGMDAVADGVNATDKALKGGRLAGALKMFNTQFGTMPGKVGGALKALPGVSKLVSATGPLFSTLGKVAGPLAAVGMGLEVLEIVKDPAAAYNKEMQLAAGEYKAGKRFLHGLLNPIKSIYALGRGTVDMMGGFGVDEHTSGLAAGRQEVMRQKSEELSNVGFELKDIGGAMDVDVEEVMNLHGWEKLNKKMQQRSGLRELGNLGYDPNAGIGKNDGALQSQSQEFQTAFANLSELFSGNALYERAAGGDKQAMKDFMSSLPNMIGMLNTSIKPLEKTFREGVGKDLGLAGGEYEGSIGFGMADHLKNALTDSLATAGKGAEGAFNENLEKVKALREGRKKGESYGANMDSQLTNLPDELIALNQTIKQMELQADSMTPAEKKVLDELKQNRTDLVNNLNKNLPDPNKMIGQAQALQDFAKKRLQQAQGASDPKVKEMFMAQARKAAFQAQGLRDQAANVQGGTMAIDPATGRKLTEAQVAAQQEADRNRRGEIASEFGGMMNPTNNPTRMRPNPIRTGHQFESGPPAAKTQPIRRGDGSIKFPRNMPLDSMGTTKTGQQAQQAHRNIAKEIEKAQSNERNSQVMIQQNALIYQQLVAMNASMAQQAAAALTAKEHKHEGQIDFGILQVELNGNLGDISESIATEFNRKLIDEIAMVGISINAGVDDQGMPKQPMGSKPEEGLT
tara:strand:+ start:2908 stop:11700 length:8793 start_codon:yes stop_codon:yes gene_type:complete